MYAIFILGKFLMMNRIEISFILCGIGFFGSILVGIISSIFHKMKNMNSFKIIENTDQIIIKNNPHTTIFNSVESFLRISSFTFLIASNNYNFYLELFCIYFIALLLTIRSYSKKMKYQVFVEGKSNSIRIKSNEYKLQDYTIEISDNKRWFWFLELEGSDSFGLYLKSKSKQFILIYGDSIHKEIELLKSLILEKTKKIS